jgi:DNA-binding transcriptional ArsR family regulator
MVLVLPAKLPPTTVFQALSDPTRWAIICEMTQVEELPHATFEGLFPISKPTISHHIKVLNHAGLIDVRKQGRHRFYTLRRETLDGAMREIATQMSVRAKSGAKRRKVAQISHPDKWPLRRGA